MAYPLVTLRVECLAADIRKDPWAIYPPLTASPLKKVRRLSVQPVFSTNRFRSDHWYYPTVFSRTFQEYRVNVHHGDHDAASYWLSTDYFGWVTFLMHPPIGSGQEYVQIRLVGVSWTENALDQSWASLNQYTLRGSATSYQMHSFTAADAVAARKVVPPWETIAPVEGWHRLKKPVATLNDQGETSNPWELFGIYVR